ncbi:DUF1816 domain-containing protein [Pseudanabaena sp. 'Roaring Creek']|uniref:DUF1816 domain-containing protein n=1 Tax=Pseudanabaena sp. 'Roaring Creek' TaxID=1681830 RepID=UPI0006D7FD77|nr:DUF1816 domain-containing protein [Pseudanabaena sp. 'Roaring Creek']
MSLSNSSQSLKLSNNNSENFYRLNQYLQGFEDEELTIYQGSSIAKEIDLWHPTESRKKVNEIRNGDLVGGKMGLESTKENRSDRFNCPQWWIKLFTAKPFYLYYFGAFQTFQEARILKQGFKQDLLDEGASIVCLTIKYCSPNQVTIPCSELTPQEFERLLSEVSDN